MVKYKVLSVRQPYASLLVSGIKDVESVKRSKYANGSLLDGMEWKEYPRIK